MQTRLTIGKDLSFRRLGFGAMRITGPGVWGPPRHPSDAVVLLRHVVDSGVNLIDTADSYGPDISEELIAQALHPYPAGFVIATKGGNLRPGPSEWVADCRPEHLRGACEGSLRRLRLECIELYQLHRVDPKVPFDDQIGALRDLQREGKIRHIGLSNVTTSQLARAQAIAEIVSVQNRYNVTDRTHEDVLEACEKGGLAFLPFFPLGAGDHARRDGGVLARVATAHGAAPSQIALAWLLRRSHVIAPIPGTSSRTHFDENLVAERITLSDADFAELSAHREEPA
ncbi:MAG: aldo/keto reductase [Candidatus Eremiobacteraeota bacterium]|nr:aldo/keto reductase [Candidatus Eremiobacteraeota bacterium]